jgi:EAL domain-containing protein (putative c-di-GMP-specific phosphodiesterase class I)/GGDEF domain-containing protein
MQPLTDSPACAAAPGPDIASLLEGRSLRAHYQPIVRLATGDIAGHESLIRLPPGHPIQTPDALFRAARAQDLLARTEQACVDEGIRGWAGRSDRLLFLNLSASTVVEMVDRLQATGTSDALELLGVAPSSLVIEITEHDHVADIARLIKAAASIRAHGLRFALDDFGDGKSSLRLWSELRPDFVKIDKYFTAGVEQNPIKVQTLRGLIHFAEIFGTSLIAEGIETEAELRVMRDLGLPMGQGYGLGRPAPTPQSEIPKTAQDVITSAEISVLPELSRVGGADLTVARLVINAPPQPVSLTGAALADLFMADESLPAVALVQGGVPVGLINRQTFVANWAKPYFKEINGRRPCIEIANTAPLSLDKHAGIDALTDVLKSPDQRYLSEGFIVTENGRYAGVGSGQQLVRMVTEARIEAARHANPLTLLPGNIPISEHIRRLLAAGRPFAACYADMNDFKPFNDHYGYWQGDEMIRLAARTLLTHCEPRRDFVGHVGGDDFVILFQSEDWESRCGQIMAAFNTQARSLYDTSALARGGIEAEDRHGERRFFPLTSLALGVVVIDPARFDRPEAVATAAAAVKHKAKTAASGLVIERA